MASRRARRWLYVLIATCCALVATPAAAQEQRDANERVRDALNAPIPIADQAEPDWWNRSTVDWRVEPAIWQAYQEFWRARGDALFELDTSRLDSIMAMVALERERAGIDRLRGDGHAQVLDVDHQAEIWEAVADEGVVYDRYVNRSYRVDPDTKERVEPEFEPQTISIAYRLQPIDGAWKVVDSLRIEDEAP